jgi:hypothetical protein
VEGVSLLKMGYEKVVKVQMAKISSTIPETTPGLGREI